VIKCRAKGSQAVRRWIEPLVTDADDWDNPAEICSLGRTVERGNDEIGAGYRFYLATSHEARNTCKRAAFGPSSFRNIRMRALLHAAPSDLSLLARSRQSDGAVDTASGGNRAFATVARSCEDIDPSVVLTNREFAPSGSNACDDASRSAA
jgi:hypothetical protein